MKLNRYDSEENHTFTFKNLACSSAQGNEPYGKAKQVKNTLLTKK